jgi:16S rRNA (adenine1518-N6/adenine1519-N6)-dimethyltransferase
MTRALDRARVGARRMHRPKQSLGQNFLVDDNIARNIVRDLHLDADDVVVEIGPGRGALTQNIAGRVRHLVAVEIDRRIVGSLTQQFASPSVTILQQDFLELSLQQIANQFSARLRVVGNIPYHLTSPILFKVFDERRVVQDCTLMVQREVAERIVAKAGTDGYGILSVFAALYGAARILFTVSPNCFYPKPKVTSAVVRLDLQGESAADRVDEQLFATIVRTAFGKRRKTLRNSLKYLPYSEQAPVDFLADVPFSLDRRAEELDVHEFIQLTNVIQQRLAWTSKTS